MIVGKSLDGTFITLVADSGGEVFRLSRIQAAQLRSMLNTMLDVERSREEALKNQVRTLERSVASLRARARKAKAGTGERKR